MTPLMALGRAVMTDLAPGQDDFARAVQDGLRRRPKAISSKYLYDAIGSHLFERICHLPEYYPTRTEMALLEAHRADIAALAGPGCQVVEFGAGSARKARLLLDALDRPAAYVPVDIAREALAACAAEVVRHQPGLAVTAFCADYTRPFALPQAGERRLGFFPGSTIGNFMPAEARAFLQRALAMLAGGLLVVGVDMKKKRATLDAAYNDAAGVTAAFNLNLLTRINREVGADFRHDGFRHRAFYNSRRGRVEMHLVSRQNQTIEVGENRVAFAEGESIHTENSHKFTLAGFTALARQTGFRPLAAWTDTKALFSLHVLGAPLS